jgi:hypothetical protein
LVRDAQFATDGPKTGHGVLPSNAGFEVRYSDAGMADDALSEPDLTTPPSLFAPW